MKITLEIVKLIIVVVGLILCVISTVSYIYGFSNYITFLYISLVTSLLLCTIAILYPIVTVACIPGSLTANSDESKRAQEHLEHHPLNATLSTSLNDDTGPVDTETML